MHHLLIKQSQCKELAVAEVAHAPCSNLEKKGDTYVLITSDFA
jgi:hypothetical protein